MRLSHQAREVQALPMFVAEEWGRGVACPRPLLFAGVEGAPRSRSDWTSFFWVAVCSRKEEPQWFCQMQGVPWGNAQQFIVLCVQENT